MADEEQSSVRDPPPPHVIAIPLPFQGHMSPLLQFAKRLSSRGVRVTFLIPASAAKSLKILPNSRSIEIALISDAAEDGSGASETNVLSERYQIVISKSLSDFIRRFEKKLPDFIVYDSIMPWILNVAKQFEICGAPFFTQSCAVNHIYELIHRGDLKLPVDQGTCVSIPSLPILDVGDLPIVYPVEIKDFVLKLKIHQFLNLQEVKWMFCNTFDKLEETVINKVGEKWKLKSIGPSIPLGCFNSVESDDDKSYGISFFNPDPSHPIIHWLNSKPPSSVLYVSFGSIVTMEETQVKEIASTLRDCKTPFIWVLGESEKQKLPTNFQTELMISSEKDSSTTASGLVVNWCHQLQILSHNSIGCFLTHSGWNSTLEALSLGVPMVALPKWSDQITNSKFIADVWKVGVRCKADDKGIFVKEEVEKCIREVMEEGERKMEIRENSLKWKKFAKEAMDEAGGTSDKNIDDFVKELHQNIVV